MGGDKLDAAIGRGDAKGLDMQILALAVDPHRPFGNAQHTLTRATGASRAHSSRAMVSKTVSASKIQPQA